ncbi:MAG: D-sedoheptulose 7-phosphate isomerase [Candidatus Omnitrophica bacterium]|nr:D-sedoheptulose 7-phosphate isomerase [Candidatus Omnitrophota bacterium]
MKKIIEDALKESIKVKEDLLHTQISKIERAAETIIDALRSGHKILVFGNGGSAADSQHFAAELVGRFKKERRPFAAIALTTNTSILTAVANDYGYEATFSRQIEGNGRKGDVAVGISTSGNAKNVIEGIRMAKTCGLITIGLTGGDGGKIKELCDISIVVGSSNTPRIQEAHIAIIHVLCELVEKWMLK